MNSITMNITKTNTETTFLSIQITFFGIVFFLFLFSLLILR